MTLEVLLRYRTRRPWAPAPATLRGWARLAAGRCQGELGIRVVGAAESRALNSRYRGKQAPTNVLSFAMPADDGKSRWMIGDVVVCAPIVAREARAQGKALHAHWAHMVIHGTLHLLGFDHQHAADA
ncbi:MAG: rRNA maturation RNase YbeY, partial [Steroidobacteraceae bacterium]